jgi:hypothetical protein
MDATPPPSPFATSDERLRQARKHVKRLRGLYQLCVVAVLVVALTAAINLLTSPRYLWFLWIAFGFSVAITFSALELFGRSLWFGPDWEQRKLREYLDRERR